MAILDNNGYVINTSADVVVNSYGNTSENNGVTIDQVNEAIDNKLKNYIPKEIYSTEEQIIGVWINGKPLYRKVIFTASGLYTNWTVIAPIIENAEMRKMEVSISLGTSFETLPLVLYYDGSVRIMRVVYSSTGEQYGGSPGFIMLNNQNTWAGNPITIFAEYTKTTDIATVETFVTNVENND